MPRNPADWQPKGPSLSREQARLELQRTIERAKQLLQEQPLTEERYQVWQTNAFEILRAAFGEDSGHVYNFVGDVRVSFGERSEYHLHAERQARLARQIRFLEEVIEEFPVETQTQSTGSDFFNDLDTDIRRVSQQLFNNGHHAEAVSAALKELNHQVKQEYKQRKNVDLDGAPLMREALSPNNPVFVLADQSTKSGKDIQQGFMELFAGSMIGIRNPHAHENLSLDPS